MNFERNANETGLSFFPNSIPTVVLHHQFWVSSYTTFECTMKKSDTRTSTLGSRQLMLGLTRTLNVMRMKQG
jgi:hypothetical protein